MKEMASPDLVRQQTHPMRPVLSFFIHQSFDRLGFRWIEWGEARWVTFYIS